MAVEKLNLIFGPILNESLLLYDLLSIRQVQKESLAVWLDFVRRLVEGCT